MAQELNDLVTNELRKETSALSDGVAMQNCDSRSVAGTTGGGKTPPQMVHGYVIYTPAKIIHGPHHLRVDQLSNGSPIFGFRFLFPFLAMETGTAPPGTAARPSRQIPRPYVLALPQVGDIDTAPQGGRE